MAKTCWDVVIHCPICFLREPEYAIGPVRVCVSVCVYTSGWTINNLIYLHDVFYL